MAVSAKEPPTRSGASETSKSTTVTSSAGLPAGGQARVVIEAITPQVDGGRFAAKRSAGETVHVECDAFTDGHDKVRVIAKHRPVGSGTWQETELSPIVNDRWGGEYPVHAVGWHEFTIAAWIDRFGTWQHDLQKRVTANTVTPVDMEIGAALVEEAADAAGGASATTLRQYAKTLRSGTTGEAIELGVGNALNQLMRQYSPRLFINEWPTPIRIWVDRAKARFSSWYELFPRSAGTDGTHGSLRDVEKRLDTIAGMGFDILYMPPIHPIGQAYRKGPNNSATAGPEDVGSPWAIGGAEGGHDAIHPQLGTIDDFDSLVKAARDRGIDVAMDLAFQCSPDHPYVKQHPNWFRARPDGTIQYAENPPKKYQDIYPFDFECDDWQALWNELLRVTLYWNKHGVKVFRVDNPHTKPFPFWEWLISEVKKVDPDVLFLAEAFTRPKIMYRLAKLGFTQSYTYFAWRKDPGSIKHYYSELITEPVVDFFRPNAWPNTPDILNDYLQTDARSAYIVRAVLAATLCANYGIYGPAFELMDGRAAKPGSEDYLDSEKYQIRQWDFGRPDALTDLLTRLNQIRKSNAALQHDRGLVFHNCDNPNVIAYSKTHGDNCVLCVVNTDPYHTQWSNVQLDLARMGVPVDKPYQLHDLISDLRYEWNGYWGVVGLDPGSLPVHVFAVRHKARTEADFDYFV